MPFPLFASTSWLSNVLILCTSAILSVALVILPLRIAGGLLRAPRSSNGASLCDVILGAGLIIFSGLCLITTVLGSFGKLHSIGILVGALLLFLILLSVIASHFEKGIHTKRKRGEERERARSILATILADQTVLIATLALLAVAIALLLSRWGNPPSSWDALTYHLTHPLHWLESGRLETLHQTVGDPSSSYYPIAAESFYMWGFLATGSDWWVPFAQFPAALLGCVAVVGLARALGISRNRAFVAGLLWIATPVLLRQAGEAENDLWISAWLLASFYLALRFADTKQGVYSTFSLAAAGLAVGTKFIGIVFLPVLAVSWISSFRSTRSSRRDFPTTHFMFGLGIALLLGGYAYLRNLVTCGNPLTPLQLVIAGHELLPGFITSQDFFESPERNLSIGEVFVSVRAFADGGASFAVGLVALLLASITALRRKLEYKRTVVTWAAVLSMIIFLFLVPNRHHRMAGFPLGLALPLVALRFSSPLLIFVMLINLAGASLYLAKGILLGPGAFAWSPWSTALSLLILAVVGLIWSTSHRRIFRRFLPIAYVLVGLGAVLTIAALEPDYEDRRFHAWEAYWGTLRSRAKGFQIQSDRADWANCWSQNARLTSANPSTVAYSGSNVPYPLRGHYLRNEILAIPSTIDCDDPYFDWGHDQFEQLSDPDSTLWLKRIKDHSVDVLCVFREENQPWPREMDWALYYDQDFELRWRAQHAALFSVRSSNHELNQFGASIQSRK